MSGYKRLRDMAAEVAALREADGVPSSFGIQLLDASPLAMMACAEGALSHEFIDGFLIKEVSSGFTTAWGGWRYKA